MNTTNRVPVKRPELLAPAGDWECARAAVENGADAVYFGLDRFNARMRAGNFRARDLPELMSFLHERGVRGYVTFNILVFPNELEAAEDYLRILIESGVDAAIVQDVGICRLVRLLSASFPLYASTQMSITSARGLAFAEALGCSLVALARECSMAEIERLQRDRLAPSSQDESNKTSDIPVFPLEVFVHGALCVAYSGQCLTSESLGGRSANRGECAQACRLPFQLMSDGQPVPLGDRRYLLSPQDLSALEVLPRLMRIGVTSLKIEGRLKSPEYVANITRIYRQAIDRIWQHWPGRLPAPDDPAAGKGSIENRARQIAAEARYELEMAFSRGLCTGWLEGANNQKLVHARFGKKRGVYLGKASRIEKTSVWIELEGPLKPGDGVVFDAGQPDQPEQGGRVYAVRQQGRLASVEFGSGDIQWSQVHPGDRLWKTSDPQLDRRLRQSFATRQALFTRPVRFEVHGQADDVLRIIMRDDNGIEAETHSPMPLARARTQPLTEHTLREQLGRLGGTPFHLDSIDVAMASGLMLPLGELNRMRRDLVGKLLAMRRKPVRWDIQSRANEDASIVSVWQTELARLESRHNTPSEPSVCPPGFGLRQCSGALGSDRSSTKRQNTAALQDARAPAPAAPKESAALVVLVRSLDQLKAVITSGIRDIYGEFKDPKTASIAARLVKTARESHPNHNQHFWLAPPRITKPGEDRLLREWLAAGADGYLARNFDQLYVARGFRCIGDYTLNVANALSADYFMKSFGLERLTASYDLNFEQLQDLLRSAPPPWFEITVHQHMPMFHMEHCVFCAFLSKGSDFTNCGRPCEKHEVQLKDRIGACHPVKADAGCRNTVFNARAQTGAEFMSRLMQLGARIFRIEFLDETPQQVQAVLDTYQRLLAGEMTGAEVWRTLKLASQLGVTRGTLETNREAILMPQ